MRMHAEKWGHASGHGKRHPPSPLWNLPRDEIPSPRSAPPLALSNDPTQHAKDFPQFAYYVLAELSEIRFGKPSAFVSPQHEPSQPLTEAVTQIVERLTCHVVVQASMSWWHADVM